MGFTGAAAADTAATAGAAEAGSKGAEAAAATLPAAADAAGTAAASAPLDLLAGGAAAGTAAPAAIGTTLGAGETGAALTSGLALEPGFAGSVAGDIGAGTGVPLLGGAADGVQLAGLTPPGATGGPSPTGGVPTAAGAGAGTPAGPISSFSPFSGGSPAAPSVQGSPLGYAGSSAVGDPTDFTTIGPGSGSVASSAAPIDLNPAAAAAPAASTTAPAAAGGGILSSLSKVAPYAALAIGGQLASPAITKALGLDKVPGSANLTNLAQEQGQLAQQQQAYGNTLEQPLVTGVLPAGQQQAVTNALNDATATIKARYAALGLSGSSMEAEAVANAQNQSVALQGQIEQEMAQTGASAVSSATQNLGLEDSIYQSIMTATIGQDQALGNAISKFATAAGTGAGIASVAKSTSP